MIILNPSQNQNNLRSIIFPPKIRTKDFLDINDNYNDNDDDHAHYH